MNSNLRRGLWMGVGAAALLAASAGAWGQAGGAAGSPAASTGALSPRENMQRLQRPITVDLNETRLEDVLKFVVEVTGVDLEPMWKAENENEGWDKETLVTVSVKGLPALAFLEKVMERLEGGQQFNTWQIGPNSQVQVGPKARLNKFKRIEIYDINDLLFVLPRYDNAPEVDLDQVLQSSGGGGSSQSPFSDDNDDDDDDPIEKAERAKEIIDIIQEIVETEQWADGGGEGGTMRYYQGNLIVNAADYMHRGVNGYRWWPSVRTLSGGSGARRYVSLDTNNQLSRPQRPFRSLPVTATTGGSGGGAGSPPGGGG